MNVKKILTILGLEILLLSTIIMVIAWYIAFLNDGRILITINTYNEMWIEFIIVPILFILGLYSVKEIMRMMK